MLETLWDAGIRTIPGGGAEVLAESVRKVIAPNKAITDKWLAVCASAHRIGFTIYRVKEIFEPPAPIGPAHP